MMRNDYEVLAKEALELAKSLSEENRRLKLSIALMQYKSKSIKSTPMKRGRKEIFSDEDVALMVEFYPKFAEISTKRNQRLTKKAFAKMILKKLYPHKNSYGLAGPIKTMQNRMIELEKSFNS